MLYQSHSIIHLNNIRFNLNNIRHFVGLDRKLLIAVKADAYGHGAVEVSKLGEELGVDYLGVATVKEAIQLRKAGIMLPILKFTPTFIDEMPVAIDYDITFTVCEISNIIALQKICDNRKKTANVHLKIDTGMGRIGVSVDDSPSLAEFIDKKCSNLLFEGIFTHLPVSDDPSSSVFTENQIRLFKNSVGLIHTAIGRKVNLVHCANSGAVLGYPSAWLDMVRPGIIVYGHYPGPNAPRTIQLKPGLSLISKISFIKRISKGTRIGYGHTWESQKNTCIGTIPIGYADGFNRLFSNSGRVLINCKSYPVVGRVCMDQIMVNLGAKSNVRVGDKVVLIGKSGEEEITCEEWAYKLKTIPYEVTCQLSSRVERIYES